MNGGNADRPTRWRRFLTTLLALALITAIVRHLPFHLDEYEQAKQAYAAYEITRGGAFAYQHAPFGGAATKPPLLAIVSAALYRVTGSWELAWRAPSLAAVAAILWMLWRRGERRLPRLGGAVAVLSFALTQLTTRLALMVRTDALLAFWWTAMVLLFLDRLESGEPWRTCDRVGLAVLLTGALFTKGPVIFAFAAFPLLASMGLPRRGLGVAAATRTGAIPWLMSLLLFLVWFAVGTRQEEGFTGVVFAQEFGQSFRFGGGILRWLFKSAAQYPLLLVLRCLPWSVAALWL